MDNLSSRQSLVWEVCTRSDLRTDDPYDIWKTPLGFRTKDLYNRHRLLGLPPAAALAIFDLYFNNRARLFYRQQEYPIVRAMAAQVLLMRYARGKDRSILPSVRQHLDWLSRNSCQGYSGPCWGLGFKYAVSKNLVYGPNTPLTTMTPYALEAFVEYHRLSSDSTYLPTIAGIRRFLDRDVPIVEESNHYLATAYSDKPDRKVINAVSYVMYSYSLLHGYAGPSEKEAVASKIRKLYNYIRLHQSADGSWPYSPEPPSFIDCFHSCIVIKNIIKAARMVELEDWERVASDGYRFIKDSMWVVDKGLFKRFARTNKPGIIRFDLYDNAEMFNLACLMRDTETVDSLNENIERTFVRGERIYSQVDRFGIRHGFDMLRWAVMPYLYALTVAEGMEASRSDFHYCNVVSSESS